MLVYGMLVLLVGLALISGAAAVPIGLHRRYHLPYALLSVGLITFTGALIVQFITLRLLGGALLGILPLGALSIGLAAGFTEETARLFGYQYLARSAVTRPQALMIGAGHGFAVTLYTGLLALGLGISLLGYGTQRPDDLAALLSGAVAEALNGWLPILMHMALSWLVLQVFLRGEIGWLFVAIFIHAVVEMTAGLLGPNDAWAVVVWRLLVALLSLALIRQVRPPQADS
jgi:uncharacterized membrane protein YhfC